MSWFDESRLDDETALGAADARLRFLAESGARVRREVGEAAEALAEAVSRAKDNDRPRAVVAAGPDSRLLRAVLEPWCPVPFVAWPGPQLPGWAGSLDLVVVLAPDGADHGTASAVAEACRRGCQVVVSAPAGSLVADHATGRDATVLPSVTRDQLATAVTMLSFLHDVQLGPDCDPEAVATALDQVAIDAGPRKDIAVNPAKMLAMALAEETPVVWGGTVLAARAARRVAEGLRRSSGRTALAGDVEQVLPVIERARPRDVFDDPFADGDERTPRPVLVVLDDGSEEPIVREQRSRLLAAAAERGVRVETVTAESGSEVARYAELMLSGTYAATYLGLALTED
ncbi:SIS domain-containing protein [Nocardioides sp. GY 10127]|uniref:SIS domain-containing protein n=1 Tax=Nocardioides sp. GY 10127 TaxID=2569762 RepID=UPI0010A8FC05|nr:SIS domain-containing protein [Nocardioides sp. GY 10127]TIC84223.1 hypothetical protein E8D37_05390 [Nocardioides sp. GY 10127]